MEAHVTAQSQTFRLRQRADEASLRHGQEVRADIPNVRVAPSPVGADTADSPSAEPALAPSGLFRWLRRDASTPAGRAPQASGGDARGDVFFCNIGPIRIREVLVEGDDETPLPATAVVEGLAVPTPGSYDLVNVVVRANGDLRLIVDEQTRLEPATPAWSSPF
ncbi:MAG: hypothetical protein ACJ79S_11375 [Gemmatimonadaceae bacterium]